MSSLDDGRKTRKQNQAFSRVKDSLFERLDPVNIDEEKSLLSLSLNLAI